MEGNNNFNNVQQDNNQNVVNQQIAETQNNVNMPSVNNGNKKNNTAVIIVIVIMSLLLIAGTIALVFIGSSESDNNKKEENKTEDKKEDDKKEDEKKEDDENNDEEPSNEQLDYNTWSGIYKNGKKNTLYIYQIDENTISFDVDLDGVGAQGTAEISTDGKTAEGDIFDTYTFKLVDGKLEFTSTDEDMKDTTFTKSKNYSKEEYYSDNYGDPKYLNTKFNGVFKKDDIEFVIYQIEEDEAMLTIVKDWSSYSGPIEVKDDKLIVDEERFRNQEKIQITAQDDSITVEASSTDPESILNNINGTYPKVKSYTIDDIIN